MAGRGRRFDRRFARYAPRCPGTGVRCGFDSLYPGRSEGLTNGAQIAVSLFRVEHPLPGNIGWVAIAHRSPRDWDGRMVEAPRLGRKCCPLAITAPHRRELTPR